MFGIVVLLVAVAGASLALWKLKPEFIMFKPIEELKVRLTGTFEVPDPTNIQSTGDWYYLDHVSGGLVAYDADKKRFVPLFAESWSSDQNGVHRFKLRQNIRFHDGTPITTKDIIWSLKRQLIKKTATHFPLWDYIVDCEGLKTLADDCDGIRAPSESEIEIRLKTQNESFFLQLASPETGIWSSGDMDPGTVALKPTKFSGAYYFSEHDGKSALLKRNVNSPLSESFPDSPRTLRFFVIPAAKLNDAIIEGTVDLVIRPYAPLGEPDWESKGIDVRSTTASNIFYLFGLGTGARPAVGRDLIEALWASNADKKIVPAETFLPFAKQVGISRSEFLEHLPAQSASKIRIFCPTGFYSESFLGQIRKAAEDVGVTIEFSFAPALEWFKAFDDPESKKKYDYMLSLYAASERYPAVQLRYMTKKLVKAPIDLKPTESPDLGTDHVGILRDYQKWLLNSRQAIPLYFGNTLFIFKKGIDIGNQSDSDAEIELWRVREKVL